MEMETIMQQKKPNTRDKSVKFCLIHQTLDSMTWRKKGTSQGEKRVKGEKDQNTKGVKGGEKTNITSVLPYMEKWKQKSHEKK